MQNYDAYDILENCLPKLVDFSYYKQTSHNDGGFNALFTLNGTVVLEFTGKGFDKRVWPRSGGSRKRNPEDVPEIIQQTHQRVHGRRCS